MIAVNAIAETPFTMDAEAEDIGNGFVVYTLKPQLLIPRGHVLTKDEVLAVLRRAITEIENDKFEVKL